MTKYAYQSPMLILEIQQERITYMKRIKAKVIGHGPIINGYCSLRLQYEHQGQILEHETYDQYVWTAFEEGKEYVLKIKGDEVDVDRGLTFGQTCALGFLGFFIWAFLIFLSPIMFVLPFVIFPIRHLIIMANGIKHTVYLKKSQVVIANRNRPNRLVYSAYEKNGQHDLYDIFSNYQIHVQWRNILSQRHHS